MRAPHLAASCDMRTNAKQESHKKINVETRECFTSTHTHSHTTNRNFGGNSPQVDAKRFSQFLSILSHSSGTFGRQRNKKKIQNDNERFFKVTFIFPIRKCCKRQRKKNIYFCSEFRRHNKPAPAPAAATTTTIPIRKRTSVRIRNDLSRHF